MTEYATFPDVVIILVAGCLNFLGLYRAKRGQWPEAVSAWMVALMLIILLS